ncbi:hypothetical protein COLO4_00051 [Corchorus olitorius]|uniref:Uncharacterized protein n=1 Tax=Corchorus olitorius TaxID=93759 RepID=A0A1R3L4U4_9ROSI|nr:hypothetical protein COLO4_00051 [Corchorus olitorius]
MESWPHGKESIGCFAILAGKSCSQKRWFIISPESSQTIAQSSLI